MGRIVQEKAEAFALRVVRLYQYLTTREDNREFVMSKQLLRSGTSIGANLAESEYAISRNEFLAKDYISLKECNESCYWLRLLRKSGYISDEEYQSLYTDCQEILRMLISITKSLKDSSTSTRQ